MNNPLKAVGIVLLASCLSPVALADDTAPSATVTIPVVPVEALDGAKAPTPKAPSQGKTISAASTSEEREPPQIPENYPDEAKRIVLTVNPGVNKIVSIARGYPNRIVTPFSTPNVISTSLQGPGEDGSCGEVCIRQNVVYVATDKAAPVTMYITEKGTQANAISITMIPKKIPPKEITLKLDSMGVDPGLPWANRKAEEWETSQPYVETIRSAFRSVALGRVPSGYTMNPVPKGMVIPTCSMAGVDIDFTRGQLVTGHYLEIFVGLATNVSNHPIEFKPATCGNWNVAAATTWPDTVIEPGQKTEIYVARRIEHHKPAQGSVRPSLLGGTQ